MKASGDGKPAGPDRPLEGGGRLSEKYLIDNQLRGPDSSSTLKKADETNLK